MAISTLDQLIAALLPSVHFYKVGQSMEAIGLLTSSFYYAGYPSAAAASSAGLSGEALTSYAGQLPFPAAVGGKNIHLARLEAAHTSAVGAVTLCDRLWHNSGLDVTSLAAQTINSVVWPARDRNGSTDGDGVMIGLEISAATGSGTPTLTVSYTNSDGTAGRTGTIGPLSTTGALGTFYPMRLDSGDRGVRSVQSITSSATQTSGGNTLVAYREIATLPTGTAGAAADRDAVALGLPRCYDNTVPFLLFMATATTATNVDGSVVWAQG